MQSLEEDGFGSNPESTTPIYEVRLNAGRFGVTMAERLYYSVNSDNGNTSLVPYDISGSVGNVTLRLMEEGTKILLQGLTKYTTSGRNVSFPNIRKKLRIIGKSRVEQVGFLTFLFFGIVIANITVLLATTLSKQGFKSRMTFFIMHLAIADLMVGLVSVLTDLLWKATGYWYAGNVMCHLVRYLQAVAMFASTYVLVALSIDRLEAIARPMSFHNSRTRARILIVAAWILSGLMALPLLVLFEETGDPEHRQCGMRLPSLFYWKLYVTLLATCLFFIPTLIISMCYCIIIYVIWSKARTVTSSSRSNKSKRLVKRFARKTNAGLYPDSNDLKSSTDCSQSSKGVIPQAKIRTIKLTLIIVIGTYQWCSWFLTEQRNSRWLDRIRTLLATMGCLIHQSEKLQADHLISFLV
ncbi:hypothetical protein LSH36_380g06017 [Paralvinella palmiformis]|uniref:G-protein coupled receptors family 1 profile domain-containing protein n=1 Tax=Paralvinella palmiformis TaxID=53620 RepID=A0AAD9JD70_9ANNE|nr:hypothetical protein LSH36_380g06017 [Paralvinella palmiformis]